MIFIHGLVIIPAVVHVIFAVIQQNRQSVRHSIHFIMLGNDPPRGSIRIPWLIYDDMELRLLKVCTFL